MKSTDVSPGTLLKRTLISKPWLFVVLSALFSYKGLTTEELREITGLSNEVVKRALWWLRKLGIIEERNNKLYVKQEFYRPLEKLLYNYCRVDRTIVLDVEDVYLVIQVKSTREVVTWSIQKSMYEKLLEAEKFTGSPLDAESIARVLGVPVNTASRLAKLRNLLEECREGFRSAGASSSSS
ncbi:MAG: hypothetical protein QW733_07515 [Desulfurococcaceae archaeon]